MEQSRDMRAFKGIHFIHHHPKSLWALTFVVPMSFLIIENSSLLKLSHSCGLHEAWEAPIYLHHSTCTEGEAPW
jgi:hypothetical protein